MRLIDADDFKEKIKGVCDAGGWLEPVTTAIKEYICKQVDYQTPVDAVEVVRCEYCKYYVGEMFFGREVFWCNRKYKQGSGMMELTDADDFCSYGERKTDG